MSPERHCKAKIKRRDKAVWMVTSQFLEPLRTASSNTASIVRLTKVTPSEWRSRAGSFVSLPCSTNPSINAVMREES